MFETGAAFFIVGVLAAYMAGRVGLDAWRWREVFAVGLSASRDAADELVEELRAQGMRVKVVVTGRGMGMRLGRPGAPDLSEGYAVRVHRHDALRARAVVEEKRSGLAPEGGNGTQR